MENDAVSSTVVHLIATVLLELDVILFAELEKFVPFFLLQVVYTDDDFSKMVLLMDLLKVLECTEHAETIAVAVAVTLIAVDETDDIFPSCAVDVNHD